MKQTIVHLLAAIFFALLSCGALADTASDSTHEWRDYVDNLAPIGERMTARMTDPQDPQLRQELYRMLFSSISIAYMVLLHAESISQLVKRRSSSSCAGIKRCASSMTKVTWR